MDEAVNYAKQSEKCRAVEGVVEKRIAPGSRYIDRRGQKSVMDGDGKIDQGREAAVWRFSRAVCRFSLAVKLLSKN